MIICMALALALASRFTSWILAFVRRTNYLKDVLGTSAA
jgi:hypothetical protein